VSGELSSRANSEGEDAAGAEREDSDVARKEVDGSGAHMSAGEGMECRRG
jgi:hypothetical protein